MKFPRSKKLVFFNNKGGVGKTTLAYNTAVQFANKSYKTVLVDLDPQCNLTRLALGEEYYENTIFSEMSKTIYDVLRGVIEGGSDIDLAAQFEQAKGAPENLYLLRGDMRLSDYENVLSTGYNSAAAGEQLGYFQTSAIDRFLREKGLSEQVDIFVIDTSPTLGLLNRVILLGSDYFVVPLMPDALSLQGIENLGIMFEKWKINWRNTGKALSSGIESQFVLGGEGLFIGYILNSYNVYGQKPIKDHRKWIDQIPERVQKFLSERHCRNGLVASSSRASLHDIQDYGRLPAITHESGVAIFNINPNEAEVTQPGSRENIAKAQQEFDELSDAILKILDKY
ncbi:AAA family ATPase [Candidatus Saccharibacteria bacterium]|nr:AAA family ATPase [Candidatus Saccharibacteria bacterium]